MRNIENSEIEGKPALCFDTALEARSFARTKLAQNITDPGIIVYPDGSNRTWKASGVAEVNNSMKIYGPVFSGERLDSLIEAAKDETPKGEALKDSALQALVIWIRAKITLGNIHSTFAPGAAIIKNSEDSESEHPKGSIYFAPETISDRCLFVEGLKTNHFTSPDLKDMEAAAFCAGTMLYEIFSGTSSHTLSDNIHQDMRDGVFLPLHLAAPGLNKNFTSLVETALLLPVPKKRSSKTGNEILGDILKALVNTNGETIPSSSFFEPLSEDEKLQIAKDKERFIKRKNASVKTGRFFIQNKAVLIGAAVVVAFFVFIITNMVSSRAGRPTTKGFTSVDVINFYYDSLDDLNHINMEACISGASKADIDMAATYFAVEKVRQATEHDLNKSIISAKFWRENGGKLPAPNVFGITDFSIELLSGNERENTTQYRVNYILWFPNDDDFLSRSDHLTLTRKRGDWKITEINRTEK